MYFKGSLSLKSAMVCVSLATIAIGHQAFAANSDLALTVTGSRVAAPQWQDGASANISTMAFAFSGVAGLAAANVDSANQTAKLINATAYPASVAVTTPSGCAIGASTVAAGDVVVLFGGAAAGGTVSITSNANQTFALRFAAAGNYGDKVGAVTCSGAGLLRYSY